MESTTDDPGQPTESAGMNPLNQGAEAAVLGKGSPVKPDNKFVSVEKAKGVATREDLDRNEERGVFLGKPKDLKAKLLEGQETKRDKRIEERLKRRESYIKERKNGMRSDREMSDEAKNAATVKVKQEQLDEGDHGYLVSKSSLAKAAVEEFTGGDQGGLAIDLTKTEGESKFRNKQKGKSKTSKTGSKSKKRDKKDTKKDPAMTSKPKTRSKTTRAKGAKSTSSAAQALIDLTKGIGRQKKIETEKKDKKAKTETLGFDFGIKRDEGKELEKNKEEKRQGDTSVKPQAVNITESQSTKDTSVGKTSNANNVYANAAQRAKDRTLRNKQTVIASRTKYRGSRRFRVTFTTSKKRVQGKESEMSLAQQSSELRMAMVNILERSKATCKRVGIHPWAGEDCTEMPTIRDAEHVPKTWGELRRYLTHDDDQFKIQSVRAGSNARWRVLINFDMDDHEKFLHLYQNSKGDWNEYPYVPLMVAPMQEQQYHCLGFLIGSSADQPTKVNEVGIAVKTEFNVGISFGNIPMDREFLNDKWNEARHGGNGKRDTFKGAPQAQNIYVNEKSLQARAVMAKKMAKHYSEMVDGKYPLFPDGSRMRFMPNHKLVPFNKREALETYANLQVTLKREAIELDIGINNPDQKIQGVKGAEGKSVGELILGLTAGEAGLPIFRHFTKSYSRKYNPSLWSVSVHPNMSAVAVDTLSKLGEILTEKYGEEVGKLILKIDSYASKAGMQNSTFKPDDTGFEFLNVEKDWYLAGNAKCMIEGMDALKETPEEKRAMDNAINSIDETKMTFLSNANTADEVQTVATEGGVSFGTVSHLSQEGEESTVAMQSVNPDDPGYLPPAETNQNGLTNMEIDKEKVAETEPSPPDTEMKNGTADGMGGSGTQAVREEEWTLLGTKDDERSLFTSAINFGLSSLTNRFSTPTGRGNEAGNGTGRGAGNAHGTEEP